MRPGHRPPRDKRYFHTLKKVNQSSRVVLKKRLDVLGKAQQRHALKAQLHAVGRKRRL
jgi:hypothetical protein